jgi:chloramphenicol-sensitive protein RarD
LLALDEPAAGHYASPSVSVNPPNIASRSPSGLPMALGAHLVWGLLPLYLDLVRHVPAFEFVGWRILFTLPFCLAFLILRGQLAEFGTAATNPAILRPLVLSALLIAVNWTVYVFAIQAGHVYAASFGYYISPLMQVLAGTIFLHERLTRPQWLAVALAGVGVFLLGWGEASVLWISLALAVSWAAYGLVRKVTPVGSLPGLTIEALVLIPAALAVAIWYGASPAGSSMATGLSTSLLIAAGGLLTAIPLLLFAIAARRMDFTVLGMLQFLSPTLVFILGVTVYRKPLDATHIAAFAIIWLAIALFVFDMWRRRRPED